MYTTSTILTYECYIVYIADSQRQKIRQGMQRFHYYSCQHIVGMKLQIYILFLRSCIDCFLPLISHFLRITVRITLSNRNPCHSDLNKCLYFLYIKKSGDPCLLYWSSSLITVAFWEFLGHPHGHPHAVVLAITLALERGGFRTVALVVSVLLHPQYASYVSLVRTGSHGRLYLKEKQACLRRQGAQLSLLP